MNSEHAGGKENKDLNYSKKTKRKNHQKKWEESGPQMAQGHKG